MALVGSASLPELTGGAAPASSSTAPVTAAAPLAGEGGGSPAREADKFKCVRGKSTPGPGEYVWNDAVNLYRPPVYTLTVPDRKNLDLVVGSWFPPPSSNQQRAPDPGHYELADLSRNGRVGAPKWSWERNSERFAGRKMPPTKVEINTIYDVPGTMGGTHVSKKMVPTYSMTGKDRTHLPVDLGTWTPKMSTDIRPGPGQYNLMKAQGWSKSTRRGCTWGARPINLPFGVASWTPNTKGTRLCNGEVSRMRGLNQVGLQALNPGSKSSPALTLSHAEEVLKRSPLGSDRGPKILG